MLDRVYNFHNKRPVLFWVVAGGLIGIYGAAVNDRADGKAEVQKVECVVEQVEKGTEKAKLGAECQQFNLQFR